MAKKKQELTSAELLAEALVREEDWPYQVPANWVWVRLGSVTEIISKGTTPKGGKNTYTEAGVAFLRVENIDDNGIIDFSRIKYIAEEIHYGYLKRSILAEGDVLISIAGTLGRTAIVNKENLPMNTNQALAFIRLIDGAKISNRYIEKALSSTTLQRILLDQTKVTSIPNLTLEIISNCHIPLPPLAEQQRIVDRIESLFDKLDQAKDLIQEALDSFETRKAAILHQAFTGQLTKKWREAHGMELESWKETKSESIFEYVTSGSRGWAQYYDTSGSVFIRMGNLDHGTIELDLADIQYVNLPEMVEGKRSKVEKNDILISITADVGMVGLVRNENMEAYINQHVALARPVKSVNAEFIAWFLVSDIGLHQLQSLQRGVTKIGLTLGDIRNLTIKLPSLPEQHEIVRILDDLFEKEKSAKELLELVDQIEAMKKTILGKAFRGELGTNMVGEDSAVAILNNLL